MAGAALVACAAVLAAGYLVDRQAGELSAASKAKGRHAHRIGQIAPRYVSVAAPKGSAKATEAAIVASARATESAAAKVSRSAKPAQAPAAQAPAKSLAGAPAKPVSPGAPNLLAASVRVQPRAGSSPVMAANAVKPGAPVAAQKKAGGAAPEASGKPAVAGMVPPVPAGHAAQAPAARPAVQPAKPVHVAAAKPAPFWMFWKQATRPAAHAAAKPALAAAPKAAVRKVVQAGMAPAVPAASAPGRKPPVPGAEGAHAQPAQALQPGTEDDFGIALPLPSQYAYNPDDRRDPFQSLLKGEFQTEQGPEGQPLVDVADLSLMGVMAAGNERYAMVEDSKHHGFTLRVGDPVMNGRVTSIEDNCLTVNLSSYGETQTVRLHLSANRNPKVGGRR